MLSRAFIFAAIASLFLSVVRDADAGAWTRTAGEGFTSQSVRYFRTDEGSGDAPPFEQLGVSLYAEYGVTDWLTVGLDLDQTQRLDDAGMNAPGGRIGGFARARLWIGEKGDVISAEFGASTPIAGIAIPAAPGGDDADEYRLRLQYGHGFQSEYGNGWAEAAFSLAHLTGGRADEAKLDLTVGVRPNENWITFGQLFVTRSLRNEAFAAPDFDITKVKFSAGRKIWGERTLIIGLARDISTRNVDPGTEISVSFWSTF